MNTCQVIYLDKYKERLELLNIRSQMVNLLNDPQGYGGYLPGDLYIEDTKRALKELDMQLAKLIIRETYQQKEED